MEMLIFGTSEAKNCYKHSPIIRQLQSKPYHGAHGNQTSWSAEVVKKTKS